MATIFSNGAGNSGLDSIEGSKKARYAQKFTPSGNYTVTSCSWYVQQNGSPSGNLIYSIFNDSAGLPGSSIGSGSVACSSAPGSYALFPINLTATLVSGTQYWAVIGRSAFDNQINVGGDTSTTPAAKESDNGGAWGPELTPTICFQVVVSGTLILPNSNFLQFM